MRIGTDRPITRREIIDEIERIEAGCGIKIGVPLLVKFRPCGGTYVGKHYFCECCQSKLNLWKIYLWFFDKGVEALEVKK